MEQTLNLKVAMTSLLQRLRAFFAPARRTAGTAHCPEHKAVMAERRLREAIDALPEGIVFLGEELIGAVLHFAGDDGRAVAIRSDRSAGSAAAQASGAPSLPRRPG